jgi:hypothetical protein
VSQPISVIMEKFFLRSLLVSLSDDGALIANLSGKTEVRVDRTLRPLYPGHGHPKGSRKAIVDER